MAIVTSPLWGDQSGGHQPSLPLVHFCPISCGRYLPIRAVSPHTRSLEPCYQVSLSPQKSTRITPLSAGSSCQLPRTPQVPKLPALSHYSLAGKQCDVTNSHQPREEPLFRRSRPGAAKAPLRAGFQPVQGASGTSPRPRVQDEPRKRKRLLPPSSLHCPLGKRCIHCSLHSYLEPPGPRVTSAEAERVVCLQDPGNPVLLLEEGSFPFKD